MKFDKSVFLIFALSTITSLVESFEIEKMSKSPEHPKFGEALRLMCKTDSYFEYCIWRHKDKVCEFEWKRKLDSVAKQVRHN